MKAMKPSFFLVMLALFSVNAFAQQPFNGLGSNMGNLFMLSNAKTRSISPENFTGEKGSAGMAKPEEKDIPHKAGAWHAASELGQGWKVNPWVHIKSGETFTLAEINGSGAIQHIWMTPTGNWHHSILRIYWDDETDPSVECPVGNFFGMAWGEYAPLTSLAICVNPGSAFNCYWTMPFRKKCRITMQNISPKDEMTVYYQIDYTLTDVPADAGYFHAQFRQSNNDPSSDYTIVDNIEGKGQYVGTFLAVGVHNNGWWGEGEIKFFMDEDSKFPTICGTGTEDYFCGSYNFDVKGQYHEFCTPYSGMHQVIRPDGTYKSQERFGLYRWHINDPIRFEKKLKVTIQDLGWQHNGLYRQQHSDMSSVCFWYQNSPHTKYPPLPSAQELDVY
jgi:hypothetical protein